MPTINNERITARVSEQIKETLIAAADLTGATLNQFLVQSALEKAKSIIEKDKIIHLGNKDAQLFFDSLENPPEPNTKLKNAVKNYRINIQ
ncbi:DUF1778 domain-containing protein [methanotrophic endosymbiont of Bathymodiolus puteoserpentis (Logatchev)]|jgi:uncharacterized protein (DUF1778 family)|uniref:type II toxin-antitoxin system TacA family antitoxin n=1 Tax=methanotrophic endosymbiont of Bathymodiolus puteoserpentis (Logatchev) TaxID=343235 RepID=UPI0013CA50B6|nr:DUF1778 domain-containing protein [methanotrophic endosymbiont of Bathymodiolus puteoserpentis (Logatchev)]SHE19771.1 FIG032766: hypothetical protein [methanotrophic endosymbiont of Bathymodiolus puteoserpentis (Logatchev)]